MSPTSIVHVAPPHRSRFGRLPIRRPLAGLFGWILAAMDRVAQIAARNNEPPYAGL